MIADDLPDVGFDGTVDGRSRLRLKAEAQFLLLAEKMALGTSGLAAKHARQLLEDIEQRRDVQIEQMKRILQQEYRDIGIDTSDFDDLSPEDFVVHCDEEPYGLHIDPSQMTSSTAAPAGGAPHQQKRRTGKGI